MRWLAIVAIAALAVASAVVLTRDPEEGWAMALVIASVAVAAAATLTMAQLRVGRGRRGTARRAAAARRGLEAGVVVALLLWLRAVDGLAILTAAFVIGTFVVAELILSAPSEPSR